MESPGKNGGCSRGATPENPAVRSDYARYIISAEPARDNSETEKQGNDRGLNSRDGTLLCDIVS